MPRRLFLFIAFGCVGLTNEIFFTAIYDVVMSFVKDTAINWRLIGTTYVWMFPIYGLAGVLYDAFFPKIARLHLIIRLIIYGIVILSIEFAAGALLDACTGRCPWEYTEGYHIMGYIRPDYFFLWAFFGWIMERIYIFLSSRLSLDNAKA